MYLYVLEIARNISCNRFNRCWLKCKFKAYSGTNALNVSGSCNLRVCMYSTNAWESQDKRAARKVVHRTINQIEHTRPWNIHLLQTDANVFGQSGQNNVGHLWPYWWHIDRIGFLAVNSKHKFKMFKPRWQSYWNLRGGFSSPWPVTHDTHGDISTSRHLDISTSRHRPRPSSG